MLRGLLNWTLLNKLEGTNHPRIVHSKPIDLILTIRHLTISFLKPWWTREEYGARKRISNVFSVFLYIAIFVLILVVAFTEPGLLH